MSELIATLKPFAGKSEVEMLVADFAVRKLLFMEKSCQFYISLSPEGKQLFEECLQKQQALRQNAMEGISEEDYQTTLLTLQKMVSNLEGI